MDQKFKTKLGLACIKGGTRTKVYGIGWKVSEELGGITKIDSGEK